MVAATNKGATMTNVTAALLLAATCFGCRAAAYEIVRPAKKQGEVIDGKHYPDQNPTQGPETPTQEPGSPDQGLPGVQQSEPPTTPDFPPDTPVQGEPPQCNAVTVCSKAQLPRCSKANGGLFGQVQGRGLFRCRDGVWVRVEKKPENAQF